MSGAVLRRSWQDESASSTIEYSLILALVAAVTIMAAESVAPSVIGSLEQLSGAQALSNAEVPAAQLREPPLAQVSSIAQSHEGHVALALAAILVASIGLVACRLAPARRKSTDPEEGPIEAGSDLATPLDSLFDKRQSMLRYLSSNSEVVLRSQLTAGHLMTQRLETIRPTECLEELKHRTSAKGIHHLLVTDEEGHLLGIISDRDLLGRSGKKAADIMTKEPLFVEPETPLSAALTLLVRRRISCLPVVQGARACGIITTTDVILALQCIIQTLERVGTVTQDLVQQDMLARGAHPPTSPSCERPSQ